MFEYTLTKNYCTMNRNLLKVLFFILCTYGSIGLYAQVPQFYNNNNSPTGANAFPLSSATSNQVQWLYGPNLFNSNGQTGTPAYNGLITTIYFRCPSVNPNAIYSNFTISLAQNMGTQISFLNGTYITGLTQSYYQVTHSLTGIVANTWYAIPLQTPFLYDPTLSLVWEMKVSAGTGNTIAQVNTAGLNQRIWGLYGNLTGTTGTALADFGFDLAPNTPCSGVPVLGTINTGNMNLCPGSVATLGLSGAALVANMTYQWQQSNNGGVTWINVVGGVGANSQVYQTPSLMTTTMYRMYGICNNSMLSDTTAPITITISSPQYTSVPYFQSFENWANYCGTKDVPTDSASNYWTNSPSTGNNSWRKNDEGNTANWTSPNLAAYTPAASHGVSSARFHSRNTLLSGNLDLYVDCSSPIGNKSVLFDCINNNASGGNDFLDVELSTDAGVTFTPLGSVYSSPNWTTFSLNIPSNSSTTLVRFKGVGDNMLTTGTDIGLDKVYILPECAGTPNAGQIADATPCPNVNFTLNLINNTLAGNLTYTWQSAPTAAGPWTLVNLTAGPSVLTSIPSATYFRCILNCPASGLQDTTQPKLINMGSFYFCYCQSQSTVLNIFQNIGNVTMIDVNNNNLINNGNPLPLLNNLSALNYYSSFFAIPTPDVFRDSTYAMSVTAFAQTATFTNGYAKVFIDYNRDGTYDPINELAISGVLNAPSNRLSSLFTVPSNAQYGLTGMRVVYQVSGNAATVGPCGNYNNGETEDYIVNISLPPCMTPPNAGIASISDTLTCPGYSVFMIDTTHDLIFSGLTFNWQYSNDGINYFDIPGAIMDTLTYTVNSETWFRFRTTCNGVSDAFSNVMKVSMSPPFACYGNSQSTGTTLDSSDIGSFIISDILTNNPIYSYISGGPHLLNPSAIKRRTDYTGFVPMELFVDSLYKFSIYHIMKGANHHDARVTMFIDYNNNKQYDIPDERVYSGLADVNNFYLIGQLQTPQTPALSVPTGLRIVLNNDTAPNTASDTGVGTYASGETEDYLVKFRLKIFNPNNLHQTEWQNSMVVYPNPSNGVFYYSIDIPHEAELNYKVMDLLGNEITSKEIGRVSGKYVGEINLSNLSSGSYLVRFLLNNEVQIRKIVIY
ncbi:MAG: T9SS type A sorting domain-containing protein [Crocinitomicaceae bacterium]|nr:MAG: T9SS type A sorting domain-containing protein [Crocinitomicaceae bacterium]